MLFLTWHRPYLALYEQCLYDEVQAAVAAFPAGARKDALTRAAAAFRIPYWDWAANPAIHALVLDATVDVEKPGGRVAIPNPLYSYRFQSTADFPQSSRFRVWKETLRCPSQPENANSKSQRRALEAVAVQIERRDVQDTFQGRRGNMVKYGARLWPWSRWLLTAGQHPRALLSAPQRRAKQVSHVRRLLKRPLGAERAFFRL